MKKAVCIILVLVCLILMSSCTGEDAKTDSEATQETSAVSLDSPGLRLVAPEGVSVLLYAGFEGNNLVGSDAVETENGQTIYTYRTLKAGNYRCKAFGNDYYTVSQNVYYSEADIATGKTLNIDPGKAAGNGFEPTDEIRLYTQEVLDNLLPSSASQWPEYAHIFTTPAFAEDHPIHQQTTQQEMMDFLYELDDPDDQMYIYILGKTELGFEIPVVVFTSTDLSGTNTLEEAAARIRETEKTTIAYEAQIHGDEPASGEACLAMIATLDGAYGNEVLDTVNIYCIPRINPDGSSKFQLKNTSDNINMNRDFLYSQSMEVTLVHHAYNLFLPEVVINGHEFTNVAISETTAPMEDIKIGPAQHLNSESTVNELTLEIVDAMFADINELGLRSYYYYDSGSFHPLLSTKNNSIGRTYSGLYGSLSFLLETDGGNSGMSRIHRRVISQYVAAESIIDYVVSNEKKIRTEIANARNKIVEKGSVYGEENDEIVLAHGTTNETTVLGRPLWDMRSGTAADADATDVIIRYDKALRTRIRPTAYVIPAGEAWTDAVLEILDKHAVRYDTLASGATIMLQQYVEATEGAELTEEAAVTFENGAIVIPMNQISGNIIAVLMEPDVDDTEGYNGTLVQSHVLSPSNGKFPIYRYIHDLIDGKVSLTNSNE